MKMNILIIVGSILIVLFLILKSDTDDVYECSNLPMTDNIVCDENKEIEKRSSTDVFSHRLVFENDGNMNENQLLNPCELKRFIQGYLRKMHNICVDVSNIKHQVHTPNNLGLNSYSIFFDIEDYINYEDNEDNIEGFQVDTGDWCDTDGMQQYANEIGINIGRPRACLKAEGSITDSGTFTGDILVDFKYNRSDEYALPLNNSLNNYSNILSFLKNQVTIRDAVGEIIESDFDFRPREAPDSIARVNTIIQENPGSLGCDNLSEGVPTLILPLSNEGFPPREGSPMRIEGCKPKCLRTDDANPLVIQNRDSLDYSNIGILSHTDIPSSERQDPYPNDLDQKDVQCSAHYSSRPDEELPKVTCDTDTLNYTFIGLENNPCQRDCTLHPDIDQEAYKISNNRTGNIMDAKFFKMPYGSTVDNHTAICNNNYSHDPSGTLPSFVSTSDGYACSVGGGHYSLQNCERDSMHPQTKHLVGYDINLLTRVHSQYVPKHILEGDHGIQCDTQMGYSGGDIKILTGNDERNYYIPTGCYKHSYCTVPESTCFQETMFFNFESGSVPNDHPNDNIITGAPEFRAKRGYETIVNDLINMIIGSYAMKQITVNPSDPSQDMEQLLREKIEEVNQNFQINIISTKYIDSHHGHMIIYRVICDSDDCELIQAPLSGYVFEEEIPDYIYAEGPDAVRSGFNTGLALPPGTSGDIAPTGNTVSPGTTGVTLPPRPPAPPTPPDEPLIINLSDGNSLEFRGEDKNILEAWDFLPDIQESPVSLQIFCAYNDLKSFGTILDIPECPSV